MVNYCCVHGCGRNSRHNSHLKFFSLPKERDRQIAWLKAAGRDDLLEKEQDKISISHRFCSRHFTPANFKNRNLTLDAVPTLCLPGSNSEDDSDKEPLTHKGIICNSCYGTIQTFRYKCVTCKDFDLCQKCEMQEIHSEHYMLRMPKPLKFKHADNLAKKWKQIFKVEHVTADNDDNSSTLNSDSSDDDEPIKKYVKNYDSGVDLSEDVKMKIRKEITRALASCSSTKTKKTRANRLPKKEANLGSRKRAINDTNHQSLKKQRLEADEYIDVEISNEYNLELPSKIAFADVDAAKEIPLLDVKSEELVTEVTNETEPFAHVKLSEDLSKVTIEMMRSTSDGC